MLRYTFNVINYKPTIAYLGRLADMDQRSVDKNQ